MASRKFATYVILFATAAVWFSIFETGVTLLREGPGFVEQNTAFGLFIVVTAMHLTMMLPLAAVTFFAAQIGARWLHGNTRIFRTYLSTDPEKHFEYSSRLIAVAVVAASTCAILYVVIGYSLDTFHARDLIAQLLAVLSVVIMLGAAVLTAGLSRVLSRIATWLARRAPIMNRVITPRVVAFTLLGALVIAALALISINRDVFSQANPLNVLFGVNLVAVAILAVVLIERDTPEMRSLRHSPKLGVVFIGTLITFTFCLYKADGLLSDDLPVRTLFFAHIPRHTTLVVDVLQRLSDSDGDGYSNHFGDSDCNDENPKIHPGAIEIPGNGVDENCMAGDAPLTETLDTTEFVGLARATNVILITVDSLRPDHMSLYGYPQPTTPNLMRFASERCTVFTHAYSASVATMPSLLSMLAGRLRSAVSLTWDGMLNPNVKTLPRLMTSFDFNTKAQIIPRTVHHDVLSGFSVENLGSGIPYEQLFDTPTSARFADGAIRLFSNYQPGDQPIFLFQHWLDPHSPYIRHKGFDQFGTDADARYLSEIAYTDHQLGRVLDSLKKSGRLADTVVIISADHGEAFDEHDHEYHGESLYEEEVRIPLIVCAPGGNAQTIDTPVSMLDIAPTVLAAVGHFAPLTMSGRSLMNAVYGRPLTERAVVAEIVNPRPVRMLVEGGWKIIHYPTRGTAELFDLVNDPGENINRLFSDPEQAGARFAMLSQIMDSVSAAFGRRLMDILVPELPPDLPRLDVAFKKGPILLAAHLDTDTLSPGQTLNATFYWRRNRAMHKPLFSNVSLLDEAGKQVWNMADPTAAFADYPTQLWSSDDLIRDTVPLALPEDLPSGDLTFCVGVSDQGRGLKPISPNVRIEKNAVCIATVHVVSHHGDRAEHVLDATAGAVLEPLLHLAECPAEEISILHDHALLNVPGDTQTAHIRIEFNPPDSLPSSVTLAQGGTSRAELQDGELSPVCRDSLPAHLRDLLTRLVWMEPGAGEEAAGP